MFQDYKVAYLRRHVRVREVRRLSFLRQSVAYLLSQSARRIPHAAAIVPIDCTALVRYGRDAKRDNDPDAVRDPEAALFRRAIRRNYSAFFLKAIAHSLHHVPAMNAFLDYAPLRNGGTLYCAEDINLSFTVHTRFGVLRPIIRNAHTKDLETVAREMRSLTRKARRTDPETLYRRCARRYLGTALRQFDLGALGALWILARDTLSPNAPVPPEVADVPEEERLQVDDVLGATCTLANIGMMLPGIQSVTAIVPPEVMFFGIGDLHIAPRVVDGEIQQRYEISVMATMDHRAFDAGEAFPFYNHFRGYIEHPERIYEWSPGDEV